MTYHFYPLILIVPSSIEIPCICGTFKSIILFKTCRNTQWCQQQKPSAWILHEHIINIVNRSIKKNKSYWFLANQLVKIYWINNKHTWLLVSLFSIDVLYIVQSLREFTSQYNLYLKTRCYVRSYLSHWRLWCSSSQDP